MAFCSRCGKPLDEGAAFCAACGAPTGQQTIQQQQSGQQQSGQQKTAQQQPKQSNSFDSFMQNLNNTPDYTAQYDAEDIRKNKMMAVLSYLWILVLIPLFAAQDSKYARFHVNQALVLDIASFVLSLLSGILSGVLFPIAILLELVCIPLYVLQIMGIINAANGRAKELPFVGKFKLL